MKHMHDKIDKIYDDPLQAVPSLASPCADTLAVTHFRDHVFRNSLDLPFAGTRRNDEVISHRRDAFQIEDVDIRRLFFQRIVRSFQSGLMNGFRRRRSGFSRGLFCRRAYFNGWCGNSLGNSAGLGGLSDLGFCFRRCRFRDDAFLYFK